MDPGSVRPRVRWNGREPRLDWRLQGPIRIGDLLVWEPLNYPVRAEAIVTRVERGRIWTQDLATGRVVYNDEDRVREACVRRTREENDRG